MFSAVLRRCSKYISLQSGTPNSQSSSRDLSVDLIRVLAVMFMVQGHTLDVLLAPQYRQGVGFDAWMFFRGLTAPMFLVLSGFSFAFATRKSIGQYSLKLSKFWRRLGRFSMFVLIGYAMHLPAQFGELSNVDESGWHSFMQVDVLQCIGVSLILLLSLALLSANYSAFSLAALCVGTLFVAAAPLAWDPKIANLLPSAVAAYFNGNQGSLFPLFPWTGYVCIGAALAHLYSPEQKGRSLGAFAALGLGLFTLGFFLQSRNVSLFGGNPPWATSPNVFVFRLGFVCLLFASLGWLSLKIAVPKTLVVTMAKRSLVIYVAHLFIVYGSAWNLGLRQRIGATLSPLNAILWAVAMLVSMAILAIVWTRCKEIGARAIGAIVKARPQWRLGTSHVGMLKTKQSTGV